MRALWFALTLTFFGTTSAHAQCCPGYTAASVCNGVTLTKSRWCIQNDVPNAQNALPKAFCNYGDKVVATLEEVFNIEAKEIVEYELDSKTGGAHTGTACSNLGVGVAYDAFSGSAYGANGFWGYVLSLHESINVWTGLASGGWPTDWWADHQSAFPNMIDFHAMSKIGTDNADANLTKAAAAQKKRFYPGGDTADAKVVALDNVFGIMPGGDGFAGFSKMFRLLTNDGIKWDGLGVENPDVKRSEYVVAYMSLAAGQSVLDMLKGPGDNGGGNICNGTADGTAGDKPYTCSQDKVDAIATAHCSAIANGKKTADVDALKSGKYAQVASASCVSGCPSECGCDDAGQCVPSWLARVAPPRDAGTGATIDAGLATLDGGSSVNVRDGGTPAGHDAGGTSRDAGAGSASGESDDDDDGPVPRDRDDGCGCQTMTPAAHLRGLASALGFALLLVLRNRRRRS